MNLKDTRVFDSLFKVNKQLVKLRISGAEFCGINLMVARTCHNPPEVVLSSFAYYSLKLQSTQPACTQITNSLRLVTH
jgi:hypothetical protein